MNKPLENPNRIGQLLLAAGLINEGQLAEALAYQERYDCKLGSALVALGVLDERILAVFLAMQRGMLSIHLAERTVDRPVLALLPAALARQLGAIPLERHGDVLQVALVDPSDADVINALAQHTGLKIEPFIAPQSAIIEALNRFYPDPGSRASEPARSEPDLDRLRSRLAEVRRILEGLERELAGK